MTDKMLDWLLKEDILNLKDGLAASQAAVKESSLLDEAADPQEFFDEDEPATIGALTPRKSRMPRIAAALIVLLLLVATAAVLFLLPPDSLGPLAGTAAGLQGTKLNVAAAKTPIETPAAPVSQRKPAGQFAATASGSTSAAVTTAPGTVSANETASETTATSVQPAGPVSIISGPLADETIPDILLPAPYNGRITRASIDLEGQKLSSANVASEQDVANAAAEFELQAIPFETETHPQGQHIHVGPFSNSADLEKASRVLVQAGITPKLSDVTWTEQRLYLNLGPFTTGPETQEAQALADKMLQLKSWIKPVPG